MSDSFERDPSRDFLARAFQRFPHPWAAYRLVTDDAGTPLDAVILDANEAFAAQYGVSAEGLREKTVRELMPGDPAGADSRIELYGRATLNREPSVFEEYLAAADRWVRVTVTSPEYLHFYTVSFDISDCKRSGIHEREISARNRAVAENAPIAVFVADSQGRYVDVNEAACEMLGYSREELLARSIPDVVPPDRIEMSFHEFETLKSAGRLKVETKMCRKDGSVILTVLTGVTLGDGTFLAYCEDVSERARAERMRDRLLAAVRAADRPIFLLDASGAFLEANDRFLALFGFAREDLAALGTGFLSREDPSGAGLKPARKFAAPGIKGGSADPSDGPFEALWRDVRDPVVREWEGILPLKRKGGTPYESRLSLRGVFAPDGTFDCLVGYPLESSPPSETDPEA